MVQCPSVCLSVPAWAHSSKPAAVGLASSSRYLSIVTAVACGGQMWALSAYVGSWTQTFFILSFGLQLMTTTFLSSLAC